MATFQNVMDDARIILNDQVSELNPIPRYTEAQLLSYARSALIEARRVRPDLFLSNLTTSFASYTVSTTIPISDDYLLPMVDYVVHRAELRDDEFAVDGRSATLYQKFKSGLLGIT
jgi:hypothetical protein